LGPAFWPAYYDCGCRAVVGAAKQPQRKQLVSRTSCWSLALSYARWREPAAPSLARRLPRLSAGELPAPGVRSGCNPDVKFTADSLPLTSASRSSWLVSRGLLRRLRACTREAAMAAASVATAADALEGDEPALAKCCLRCPVFVRTRTTAVPSIFSSCRCRAGLPRSFRACSVLDAMLSRSCCAALTANAIWAANDVLRFGLYLLRADSTLAFVSRCARRKASRSAAQLPAPTSMAWHSTASAATRRNHLLTCHTY
jgi:hypothetical protein